MNKYIIKLTGREDEMVCYSQYPLDGIQEDLLHDSPVLFTGEYGGRILVSRNGFDYIEERSATDE